MSRQHLCEIKQIDYDPAPNVISIVDMVKTAYERGLFKKLRATSRKEADSIDLSEIDAVRLVGYFSKRPEFNREDHNEAGIHSVEFISDEFDIEIYDSFLTIYRLED